MITKDKFELYNDILKREEKNGIKDWMSKVIVMCSDNQLTREEAEEITKNYSIYENQFK